MSEIVRKKARDTHTEAVRKKRGKIEREVRKRRERSENNRISRSKRIKKITEQNKSSTE